MNAVTSNDGLAYNEKARHYRIIYPYLRCWLIVLDWGSASLPARLVRAAPDLADLAHVGVIVAAEPTEEELTQLVTNLGEDIEASRRMQSLLLENRKQDKAIYRFCRRTLVVG
jgi:hypothetical protein